MWLPFGLGAFFPSGNNTDWKPFVIWMPKEKCDMLNAISSTRSILGMAREYESYISFHPNPVVFFSLPSTICFGILSAEFSPTLIGGDSKAKFILGHGARKLHPLGPWSGLVQGCHNVFFYKVTRNNHQQSKAKHKIMFNWNRVIVCTE